MSWEVLVVGGGPAGLGLAAACAQLGLGVGCLVPDIDERWPNNYGAWVDDLAPLDLQGCFAHTWSRSAVYLDETRAHTLSRAYGRIHKPSLRATLLERLGAHGGRLLVGRAASVRHDEAGSEVRCEGGEVLRAALVIDATGHQPALLEHPGEHPLGWQTAYGEELEAPGHGLDPDTFVMMDFRDPAPDTPGRCPSFLYAMPVGPDRVFVEETSLIANPPPPFELLRGRMALRLERLGVRPTRVLKREHCLFPMGVPLPDRQQRVVGYGAAAGMVHPATGYMVGRSLKVAPRVAEAIARALRAPEPDPALAARAAWGAIWPAEVAASRELYLFGASALLQLELARIRGFFSSFFGLPVEVWSAYLDGDTTPAEVAAAMGRMFLLADSRTRRTLLRAGVSADSFRLIRSLAGL